MAIGNKGFYATVQAPKANIGDIAENAVDKKLARDAAKKKAKAEKEAKKEKLTAKWEDITQSNRSLLSDTLTKTVFDIKRRAVIANEMFAKTDDPKYKQEFLSYEAQMENLSDVTKARAIVEKDVQDNSEKFNRFALEDYNSVYNADSKGNVELYVSKEGGVMAKTWSVDEATGVATVISDVPFQENLKRPKLMAFDWDSNLKNFLDTVDLDEITESKYYTSSVFKKEIDERVKKQVKSKVNNLAENIDAVSDWWIKNNGNNVEAFRELKSMGFKVGEEAVEEFKKEKEEEILQSIAETRKESKSRHIKDTDGNKPKINSGEVTTASSEGGEITVTKTGEIISRGYEDGSSVTPVSKSNMDAVKLAKGVLTKTGYDSNGAFVVVLEPEENRKGITARINIAGQKEEDGSKAPSVSAGVSDSGTPKITKIYREGSDVYAEATGKFPNYKNVKNKNYNDFVRRRRAEFGMNDSYSNDDVISKARKEAKYTAGERTKHESNVKEFMNHDDIKRRVAKLKSEGKIKDNATDKEIVDYFKNNVKSVWDKWNKGGKMEKTKSKSKKKPSNKGGMSNY